MIGIREDKLRELLNSRKEFIGTSSIPWDGWFADLAFLLSIVMSDYKSILSIPADLIRGFFFVAFFVYTLILTIKTYRGVFKKYTVDNLFEDIENSSDRAHKFNLIVIRNTFNLSSSKFLLLYDNRWKCYMFPYCKSIENEEENRRNVKSFLHSHLGIDEYFLRPAKVMETEHEKYSFSDRVYKHYIHEFFEVDIAEFIKRYPENTITKSRFKIDGYKFRWFTIAEMTQNRIMQKKNKETIEDIMTFYGT